MDTVSVQRPEFILTTLTRRGAGKEGDPIRIIPELWSLDGKRLGEYDPCREKGKRFSLTDEAYRILFNMQGYPPVFVPENEGDKDGNL
jgi:hypothetical protein